MHYSCFLIFCLYIFCIQFYSICHPLSGHFRAALQREGSLNGFIPISVMTIFDSKLSNLCKKIKPETESKPLEVMSIVMDAATRLPEPVLVSREFMSLKRTSPYPPEVLESVDVCCDQETHVKAIRIPYLVEKDVEPLTLDVSANKYYMDAIARELGAADASMVLLSRYVTHLLYAFHFSMLNILHVSYNRNVKCIMISRFCFSILSFVNYY